MAGEVHLKVKVTENVTEKSGLLGHVSETLTVAVQEKFKFELKMECAHG